MSEQRIEKLFKWVDIIRVILYVVVASAVGVAVWSTKIQMTVNAIENHINDMEKNSAIHRDNLKEKEIQEERRLTGNEKDIEWLKKNSGR
jgi:hypothetical protein